MLWRLLIIFPVAERERGSSGASRSCTKNVTFTSTLFFSFSVILGLFLSSVVFYQLLHRSCTICRKRKRCAAGGVFTPPSKAEAHKIREESMETKFVLTRVIPVLGLSLIHI